MREAKSRVKSGTKSRRLAERDFWLEAAEAADGKANAGLCAAVCWGVIPHRLRAKNLFAPHDGDVWGFWWALPQPDGCNIMPGAGPKGGRVLAALLLAAMAEAGDLDWTWEEDNDA